MMRKLISSLTTGVFLSSSLIVGPVAASTPSGLSDLIGARGSSVDGELERRGYRVTDQSRGIANFYWNSAAKACVSVAVDDGRVQSIEQATASDCGQASGSEVAVGIAVGLAAVGLAAALSKHHDSSKNRNNNESYNSEYERGYHDALYGGHYDSDDSEAYHSGFMAGEAERGNRRAANRSFMRGAPKAAQSACMERADDWLGVPRGSSVPVNVFDYGQGNYEITLASGHYRAKCSVNAEGQVADIVSP